MAATPEKFLTGARRYLRALEILVDSGEPLVEQIGLLASQCVELVLKAYLLEKNWTEARIRKRIGHDLTKAWNEACNAGLGINREPPWWLQLLDLSHDAPYLFRYPKKGEAAAIPPPDQLFRGVKSVFDSVQRTL